MEGETKVVGAESDPAFNPSFQSPLPVITSALQERPLFPGFVLQIYVHDPKLPAASAEKPHVGAFLLKDDTNSSSETNIYDELKGRELLNHLHEIGLLDLINKQKGYRMRLHHPMERHYCILSFPRDVAAAEAESPPSAIAFELIEKGASVEEPAVAFDDQDDQIDDNNLATYDINQYVYLWTPVGVAMALSWTTIGGSASYMETTLVERGEAIGCLNIMGEVGKETFVSACIAYKVAHQILLKKQPENTFFANSMICLHLPKSNGTSAGCTMVTSFLSLAIKKPVRTNLTMTGTVTLSGKILRIGSVKEKTIAAKKKLVKTLIFPEANRRDFDKLPNNLKEGINVHFVDEYEQIFELAFNYDH